MICQDADQLIECFWLSKVGRILIYQAYRLVARQIQPETRAPTRNSSTVSIQYDSTIYHGV